MRSSEAELPRISVSRSITRKVGDNFEKMIFSAEKSLATTQPIEAGLSELNLTVEHAIDEAQKGQSKESTRTTTPTVPAGEPAQTQADELKLLDSAGTTRTANIPQQKRLLESRMRGPLRVWSSLPTLANLLKESERSIQKDKEIFATMTIREFDDGHDEFLVTPNYGYLVGTGPMQGFLRNTILEPQKVRAIQRNSTIPFQYEIRESNNGLLKEIWISCKKFESKDMELNLINPLTWTFQHILHPDFESNAGER